MAELNPRLIEEVRRDLEPVRSYLAPPVRTVLIILIAAVTAMLFLLLTGVRGDIGVVPSGRFLLVLLARIAAGVILLSIGLREAVPSEGVSHGVRIASLLGAAALLLLLPIALANGPYVPFELSQLRCYRAELLIAAPAFAASSWLLARSYPVRPLFASTAIGVGAGLLADAILFAHCPIDSPMHLLLAHETGVLTLGAAGAFLGWLLQRTRRRSFLFVRP